MLIALLLQIATLQAGALPSSPAAVTTAPGAETVSPAMAAAKANRPRVKTAPKWASGPASDYPDAERALGHHGRVVVSAIIGADGKVSEARVIETSGAPALDAVALAAATGAQFEPARDAEGVAIAIPAQIPYEFDSYRSPQKGGGLVHYGCGQFVRDMDWWHGAFPNARYRNHELFYLLSGLGVMVRMQGGTIDAKRIGSDIDDLEKRYVKAIEKCRAAPDARFVEMIEPEGKWVEKLAKANML